MKYSEVKDRVRTGDVFLFQGRRWYSRIIRRHTESPYSHVGIAHRVPINGHTRLSIFEAVSLQGVRIHPMDRYMQQCVAQGTEVEWYALADGVGVSREKVV